MFHLHLSQFFQVKEKVQYQQKSISVLLTVHWCNNKISGLILSTVSLGNQKEKLEKLISPTVLMGSSQPMYNAANRSQSFFFT